MTSMAWRKPVQQLLRPGGNLLGQRNMFPTDYSDIANRPDMRALLDHPAVNRRKYVYAHNDFSADAPAATGSDFWREGASGSGSGTATLTTELNGAIQLSSGTSLNGYTYVQYGQNNAPVWSAARHPHFEGRLVLTNSLPVVTEAHVTHIGFADDWTAASPNNVIALVQTTTGNWTATTRTGGGAAVTTDLGLAPLLNTWYIWTIDIDTKGSRVQFNIYTSAWRPVFVAGATHTTGIPSAALNAGCRTYNTAAQTATRDISVDYFTFWQYRWDAP